MSKYESLWKYIKENNKNEYKLSFEEVKKIVGFDFDHAFLTFKKELLDYGYEFKRLSLKEKWVWIVKKQLQKEITNMKNNYLLVHGSFGSPFSNWIPWLRSELEKDNLVVYTPDFPTGVGYQNYDNWSKLLKTYVEAGIVNENTIIYAHSIAPIFICNFLVENKIKVKRLVFACGFNNYLGINEEYDSVNESMYFDNLEDIKKYCDEIICYYSDNDPYVKYDVEKEFADTISTEQHCIHNGGHLNAESNYNEFKELLNHK